MIEFKSDKEKETLIRYASRFNDDKALDILGVGYPKNDDEVRILAKLYWRIVESSTEDDIEQWLERIYTSIHIYCSNEGFEDTWDSEIP